MLDIIEIKDGEDLKLADSVVPKAANIIATQLYSLEYAYSFGVDLKYFLDEEIEFQNESFKTYLVDRLVQQQVNVSNVIDTIEQFVETFSFSVGDANTNLKGFIR